MGYHKYLRQNNERKKKSFLDRYGMTRKEWVRLKKEDPKLAHEIRQNAESKIVRKVIQHPGW